jgi:hypothetical protein
VKLSSGRWEKDWTGVDVESSPHADRKISRKSSATAPAMNRLMTDTSRLTCKNQLPLCVKLRQPDTTAYFI